MKYLLFVFCFLLLSPLAFAQGEAIGYTTSNYAGVNSVLLNPSAMHNQNSWLSFNLLSGNLFLHTDYLYLSKDDFRLKNLFKPNFEIPLHPIPYGGEERAFYSYDRNRNTSLDQSLRILGPSLMMVYNQHAIAITSAVRTETNVRNLSPELANLITYGYYYYPEPYGTNQIKNLNSTTMTWSEIGLSYAYRIDRPSYDGWSFGISLKRLMGTGGSYMDVKNSTYTIIDSRSIDITSQQAEIGFSAPIDYNTNDYIPNNLFTGKGWSIDLGFTYQNLLKRQPKLDAKRFCEQPKTDYKYRIGIALLDIGSISYKQNAQKHDFSTTTPVNVNLNDFNIDNMNQLMALMSERFYGSASASFVENSIRIALPMALSVQADYNMEMAHLYWNASLIYGIPLQGAALRRPTQFTIAPRYETRWLEFGLPLSLYQFQYPHLGAYARVAFLTIGSEWFSTLLGNRDFNGVDIYFSVKFQLEKDNCRSRRSKRGGCGDKNGHFMWAY